MSALNGKNYQKAFVNNPSERPNIGDYGGAVKIILDSADSAIAADTVKIGKLPKGAKVLKINSIGLGTGGSFNVAPMDLMSAETDIIVTVGTSPASTLYAWVEYVVV